MWSKNHEHQRGKKRKEKGRISLNTVLVLRNLAYKFRENLGHYDLPSPSKKNSPKQFDYHEGKPVNVPL